MASTHVVSIPRLLLPEMWARTPTGQPLRRPALHWSLEVRAFSNSGDTLVDPIAPIDPIDPIAPIYLIGPINAICLIDPINLIGMIGPIDPVI